LVSAHFNASWRPTRSISWWTVPTALPALMPFNSLGTLPDWSPRRLLGLLREELFEKIIGFSTRSHPQEFRGKVPNTLISYDRQTHNSPGDARRNPGDRCAFELIPGPGVVDSRTSRLSSRVPQESSPAGIQFSTASMPPDVWPSS
jgi:hypothetical protein